MTEIRLPRDVVYSIQLRKAGTYFKVKENIYSLSDADDNGCLKKKYVIVECVPAYD